jgi:hypothetical protein
MPKRVNAEVDMVVGAEAREAPVLRFHVDGDQRWLGESEQSDKWFPCLIAALMPRSRREHVETITAQP